VGGGIGLAPLRSLINYVLSPQHRGEFGEIFILYGARSPEDLVFKWELGKWEEREDLHLLVTVDRGDSSWRGRVGLVPQVLKEEVKIKAEEWKSISSTLPIKGLTKLAPGPGRKQSLGGGKNQSGISSYPPIS